MTSFVFVLVENQRPMRHIFNNRSPSDKPDFPQASYLIAIFNLQVVGVYPGGSMTIKKILVANRGEIAARIVRTVRDLGLGSVAVYADQDIDNYAVTLADEAYSLGGNTLQDTYLDIAKIINIAKRSGADAIHPGYGFLSEDPEAAQTVADSGLIWIGPTATTIRRLGDKLSARRVARVVDVVPIPGTINPVESVDQINDFISVHGYPVVFKRSDGGGGRGIEIVHSEKELKEFITFNTGLEKGVHKIFIERFIPHARHIETQCIRDSHGNFDVVTTRDCSVQRRNQKVIEESPAPFLSEETRKKLTVWSRALFEHTDYVGVGTCEFLLTKEEKLFFLEVNPRLQVEHTVSEEITGLDLVEAQLNIAAGDLIPNIPNIRGHSIELRVTSEDPYKSLTPTSGKVRGLLWPLGHGVRIESGVKLGDQISPEFDSMIAKLIITGPNRSRAIARARRALREMSIHGVSTSVPILNSVISHPDFSTYNNSRTFRVDTQWLERELLPSIKNEEINKHFVSLEQDNPSEKWGAFTVQLDGQRHHISLPYSLINFGLRERNKLNPQPLRSSRLENRQNQSNSVNSLTSEGVLQSPAQAVVTRVGVKVGNTVHKGDAVVVLEAMKMENHIHSPSDGIVRSVDVEVGQSVHPGDPLLRIDTENNS